MFSNGKCPILDDPSREKPTADDSAEPMSQSPEEMLGAKM